MELVIPHLHTVWAGVGDIFSAIRPRNRIALGLHNRYEILFTCRPRHCIFNGADGFELPTITLECGSVLSCSIIAYDENIDSETKEKCRQETETLAILTGLEIDSAKSGIKPDLSEYLSKKKVKRSSFLNYKTILESSEERRPWYEPTFDEQFKEYFGSTDWKDVSSNLEKLPYYAQMLKKNTPKAKRKPAKASELFTFATEQGWGTSLIPISLNVSRRLSVRMRAV